MGVKQFTTGEVLTAADTNTYLNNGGLVYIKSQTIGTAVSSVEVTGAFSADYDAYLITVCGGSGSTTAELQLQLGATVSNYRYSFIYTTYNSTVAATGSSTAAGFLYAGASTTTSLSMNVTLINPFAAEHTTFSAFINRPDFAGPCTGMLNDTTSYTAFTVKPSAGTLTGGTIRVYGYRQA